MAVPCVVLASKPVTTRFQDLAAEDQEIINRLFPDTLEPGPADVDNDYDVRVTEPERQDGGNGGGGEPGVPPEMQPVLGYWRRVIWDFQTYPAGLPRDERFPKPLRFELCIPFDDISDASDFLHNTNDGQRFRHLFGFVQIVSISPLANQHSRAERLEQ